jgi:CRISPR/Cas system CMR-associated protein Cmr5 small subunit
MGLFDLFLGTEGYIRSIKALLNKSNSAGNERRQAAIQAKCIKKVFAVKDMVLINKIISRIEHMSWPNREEQQTGMLFRARAEDIINTYTDPDKLYALNKKIDASVAKMRKSSERYWSNCVEVIISERIKEIKFRAEIKSEDDLIRKIEKLLRDEGYGVSSTTLDLVKKLNDMDAVIRFAYDDIGNDVARSHIENYLFDVASESKNVYLLEQIVKRSSSQLKSSAEAVLERIKK